MPTKLMQIDCITDGDLGIERGLGGQGVFHAKPQPLDNFCDFSAKIAIIMPFGSHFARVICKN